MDIKDRIRKARENKDLSTYKLAEIMTNNGFKISQSTISKIENGNKKIDIDILQAIADALGVPIHYLIGLENEYNRASSLSNTYFDAIIKWSEDRIFTPIETVCIKEHFFDLLLRYKELITSLSNSQYVWKSMEESYLDIYKDKDNSLSDSEIKELFLKQRLEKEIINLVNWIQSFPNWMARREDELLNNKENK